MKKSQLKVLFQLGFFHIYIRLFSFYEKML